MQGTTDAQTDAVQWRRVARRTAWGVAVVAGCFTVAVAALLLANWVQMTVHDPLDNPALTALRERVTQTPADAVLRDGLRVLDLQSRRAFFLQQSLAASGAWLLLVGAVVFATGLRVGCYLGRRPPELQAGTPPGDRQWQERAVARRVIAAGGLLTLLAAGAGLLVWQGVLRGSILSRGGVPGAPQPAPATPGIPGKSPVRPQPIAAAVADKPDEQAGALPDRSSASIPPPASPTPPSSANWPFFRGPDATGVAVARQAPTNWHGASGAGILWKSKPPKPGFSSPIVWQRRVFVTGADAQSRDLYAFDADTGALQWTVSVTAADSPGAKLPEVSEDTGFAAPTAAADGGHVAAIFATGELVCADHAGKRLWVRNLGQPENHYGHASSLVLHEGLVLVQFDQREHARLLAVQAVDGKTRWEVKRPVDVSWASPALLRTPQRVELVLSAKPFIIGYDPAAGTELWRVPGMDGEVGPSPGYADGLIVAANDNAVLLAIDAQTHAVRWKSEDDLPDTASPLVAGRFVFTISSGCVLTCYAADSGKVLWKQEFDEPALASPVLVGDLVYMLDRKGVMRIFKNADQYVAVAAPELGEPAVCTPAIVDGRLYLRGLTQLYAVGAAAGAPR